MPYHTAIAESSSTTISFNLYDDDHTDDELMLWLEKAELTAAEILHGGYLFINGGGATDLGVLLGFEPI